MWANNTFLLRQQCMHPIQHSSTKWAIEKFTPAGLSKVLVKWHLDEPRAHSDFVGADEVLLRGWALGWPETHAMLHFVVRSKAVTYSYPLLEARPDVIKTILDKAAEESHPRLACGFRYILPREAFADPVEIGFETDGLIHVAARLALTS
jgi:hypothetical protein